MMLRSLSLSHLPTWMLIVGYPVFWLELFLHRSHRGITSPIAWMLFFCLCLWAIWQKVLRGGAPQRFLNAYHSLKSFERMWLCAGGCLVLVLLCVSAYASYFPPHLQQEYDALNYHYSLPRQHLIRNSFEFISWATTDLFLLVLQFALAPFWLVSELPNKLPQFIFALGLVAVSVRAAGLLGELDIVKKGLIVIALLGSHGIGIQMGTAMLDVVIAYLLVAALDSLLRGQWFLAAVEFCFYFWSKPFTPPQTVLIIGILAAGVWVFKKRGYVLAEHFRPEMLRHWPKAAAAFAVLSIVIAGPFVAKSWSITGSPLYPLMTTSFSRSYQEQVSVTQAQSFAAATQEYWSMKDAYGMKRTVTNFFQHLWLVAVPENGVNNRFDYPIGLVYLLCLGPFVWLNFRDMAQKRIGLVSMFIVLFWLSWWFGSQQSRFLFVPLVLMFLVVIPRVRVSRIFLLAMILAILLNTLSVVRAHKGDWGKGRQEVLRDDDRRILEMNRQYSAAKRSDQVELIFADAAFAQFPVFVTQEKLPFVIKVEPR